MSVRGAGEAVTAQTRVQGSETGPPSIRSLQSAARSYKAKWMFYLRLVPLGMEEKSSARDKKLKS